GLLSREPRGRELRPFGAALCRAARQLPPAFPGARRARIPLRLGGADLFDDSIHAVLRGSRRRPHPLWPGIHRPRSRDDPPGGTDPGAHGARAAEPAARSGPGAQEALSLSLRAAALALRPGRHEGPAPRGRGGPAGPAAAPARRARDRAVELRAVRAWPA